MSDKWVCKLLVTLGGTNYEGTVTGSRRILGKDKDISKATFKIATKDYTGDEVELTAADITTAKIKSTNLTLDTHFEIAGYEKDVNKGTVKVTFKGMGDFGGEKTVTFKIGQRDVVENWWEAVAEALFH